MKIDKNSAYAIWQTGDKVAKCVPEIAPEIRSAISIVQNPGTELTESQVKHSLSEILRICKEHSEFLSPVNTGRLHNFFNELADASGLDFHVESIYGTTIYGCKKKPLGYTRIMRELTA